MSAEISREAGALFAAPVIIDLSSEDTSALNAALESVSSLDQLPDRWHEIIAKAKEQTAAMEAALNEQRKISSPATAH